MSATDEEVPSLASGARIATCQGTDLVGRRQRYGGPLSRSTLSMTRLAAIRARAWTVDRLLEVLAEKVIDNQLRFERPTSPDEDGSTRI